MKDPRLAQKMDPRSTPFDVKRMAQGGRGTGRGCRSRAAPSRVPSLRNLLFRLRSRPQIVRHPKNPAGETGDLFELPVLGLALHEAVQSDRAIMDDDPKRRILDTGDVFKVDVRGDPIVKRGTNLIVPL